MTDLTHDGITQPISEWAADYGIPCHLIRERLGKGWSVERAITQPMQVRHGKRLDRADLRDTPTTPRLTVRSATYLGETLSLSRWARRFGINYATLAGRLERGWTMDQAVTGNGPKRVRVRHGQGAPSRSLTLNGETLTLGEWANRLGVTKVALHHRLKNGWSLERTLTTPKTPGAGPRAANDDRRLEATA